MMARRIAAIALLAVLLIARPVAAQPTDEALQRAGESFRQAQAAFARREYAAAAAAFEQAARMVPHPTALLNAAEAWELAGDLPRAAESAEKVLALPEAEASFRTEAEARLAAVVTRIARIRFEGPATLRARIDGGEELALPVRRWLTPGPHAVEVSGVEGGPYRRQMTVQAGEDRTVDLSSPPPSPVPKALPPAPPPRPRPKAVEPAPETEHDSAAPPPAAWVSFGLAAAGGIVIGVFGGLTIAARKDFDAEPTQDHADTFNKNKLVTNVAIGITAAAAAVGAIVWIVDASTGDRRAAIAPRIGAGSAGIVLSTRF